jgi:2,4-dienoyl-CoA reductase-like NADH-dependent reductase (Old Yellow Enzyme family)
MKQIFEKTTINGMTLANRLVRSATWEGMCEADGRPTAKLASCYRDLASGGVGLIITGYTFVRPDGKPLICETLSGRSTTKAARYACSSFMPEARQTQGQQADSLLPHPLSRLISLRRKLRR